MYNPKPHNQQNNLQESHEFRLEEASNSKLFISEMYDAIESEDEIDTLFDEIDALFSNESKDELENKNTKTDKCITIKSSPENESIEQVEVARKRRHSVDDINPITQFKYSRLYSDIDSDSESIFSDISESLTLPVESELDSESDQSDRISFYSRTKPKIISKDKKSIKKNISNN